MSKRTTGEGWPGEKDGEPSPEQVEYERQSAIRTKERAERLARKERLELAAPELLEALENLMVYGDWLQESAQTRKGGPLYRAVESSRAAIAKATGRAGAGVIKTSTGWERGEANIGHVVPSWLNRDLGYLIIQVTGADVGCRGAAKTKKGFIVRDVKTGREDVVRPSYDCEPSLRDAQKLAQVRAEATK